MPISRLANRAEGNKGSRRYSRSVRSFGLGNLGDSKSIGDGVHELRISFGPGYRAYFGQDGLLLVVLLCGGDKGSQKRDIAKAKTLWREYYANKKLSK